MRPDKELHVTTLSVSLSVGHCVEQTNSYILLYTVNHEKGGSTFVIITLENLERLL